MLEKIPEPVKKYFGDPKADAEGLENGRDPGR